MVLRSKIRRITKKKRCQYGHNGFLGVMIFFSVLFKIFFYVNHFQSLLSLLQYCLCFMFLVIGLVGSQLPDQESNPHPLHYKANLNHQATREVPFLIFTLQNFCIMHTYVIERIFLTLHFCINKFATSPLSKQKSSNPFFLSQEGQDISYILLFQKTCVSLEKCSQQSHCKYYFTEVYCKYICCY